MHRLPSTEPRAPNGLEGYTLIEVVVAMLMACIIITAVFSTSLTAKVSGGKSDRRLLASQAARQLTGRLRNFVTGCDCNILSGVCNLASCAIQGPTPRGGVASWYLNCPGCSPPIIDCYYPTDPVAAYAAACGAGSDTYALHNGYHSIAGLLPASFEGTPYNARVVYTVSTDQAIGTMTVPKVVVNVQWKEP